jgi:hypothetical protein
MLVSVLTRDEGVADRRWDDRRVERRVVEDDEKIVIYKERRAATVETPWYREPQRWIESINPF